MLARPLVADDGFYYVAFKSKGELLVYIQTSLAEGAIPVDLFCGVIAVEKPKGHESAKVWLARHAPGYVTQSRLIID